MSLSSWARSKSATGHIVGLTPFGQAIYVSPLRWVVMLAPLAARLRDLGRQKLDVGRHDAGVFLAFAALIGLSLSTVFVVFTGASIARVFFMTAASFGALSLYGYTTRRSLSAMGSFMVMGLFGLIIASVVNIFLHSTGLQWALSVLGIGIFAGLTAWDTQAIKEEYYAGDGYEVAEKKAIYSALRLYLDFINMFQQLLYLFGDRRS